MSNPIVNAYQGSDLFGKAIFLALFFLSILTWILFLKKFFSEREARFKGFSFQEAFKKKRSHPLSMEVTDATHPFALLYRSLKQTTVELLNKNRAGNATESANFLSRSDIDLIEAHLMSIISAEEKRLGKNIFMLSTIMSLAPFLGLLGTVWGILLTFAELQNNATANANATVMGGLAMALGTTVLGLLVAIPALIAYNYLKSAITNFSVDMEDFSHLMLASVELHYRQIDIQ